MSRKPGIIKVETKHCDDEWLISVRISEDETTIMPKASLWKFYEPAKQGRQGELFGKPETMTDRLKRKHLNPNRE